MYSKKDTKHRDSASPCKVLQANKLHMLTFLLREKIEKVYAFVNKNIHGLLHLLHGSSLQIALAGSEDRVIILTGIMGYQ